MVGPVGTSWRRADKSGADDYWRRPREQLQGRECHGFLGSFRQKTAERASEVQTAADSTGGEMGDPDPAS